MVNAYEPLDCMMLFLDVIGWISTALLQRQLKRPGTGKELYAADPTFRSEMDRCAESSRGLSSRE